MMSNDIISQLQQYRIILTATQGRTGTKLLAELLNLVPGVHAEHESAPPIDNIYWRLTDRPFLAREWLQRSKLPAVLKTIQESGATTYVETSHMLCKGFFRPLRALGIDFDLIILDRELREIALSLHSLADIPHRTRSGRRWLLDPEDHTNYLKLSKTLNHYSDYQLVFWYVLEMECRKEYYYQTAADCSKAVVPMRVARVHIKDLIHKSKFRSFLDFMGLPDPLTQKWHDYKLLTLSKCNEKSKTKAFVKYKHMVPSLVQDIEKQELTVYQDTNYEEVMRKIRQE